MNFEGNALKVQDKPILISKNFVYDTDPVVQIACGQDHSGFLTKSGKVYLWGGNLNHQTCDKPWMYPILPIYQTIEGLSTESRVVQIELTEEASYALTSDGELFTRGGNTRK
jgi:alpha-tubulin suppressor-like RCC1 family protein